MRKFFCLGLAIAFLGAMLPLSAQVPKTVRVGILSGASLSTPANAYFRDAFVESMRQRGWVEGQNLIVEARATEGKAERYAEFAGELVASNMDVVIASGSQAVQAFKDKTATVPIVMLDASHPVEAGFVISLSRPGGNITGVTPQLDEVNAKAIEALKELRPTIDRVGILYTPSNIGSSLALKQSLEIIPVRLGIKVFPIPIDNVADIATAFTIIDREKLVALHVHPTPIINTNRLRIAALAIERRILTATGFSTLVRDGILMSYGPDQVDSWRGAASFVDRILRGAKPAEMPVERPTKFLFVINLKTANALGVVFPSQLHSRADEVIE
jgi:putative tryptophan/tyrosine transport system substrate-binding protein